MIVFGSAAHGAKRRRQVGAMGIHVHKGEWMESGDDPRLSPTISLIEQPAGSVLGVHFHRQNQFQVFVEGGGTIGPAPLSAVTIHYAGAYTAYGPLAAGGEGIKYFTIRPVCESGAYPVETSREHMVRGPKRHATSAALALHAPEGLARLRQAGRHDAIAHAADGLGASVLSVPPGEPVQVPWAAGADGVFLLVLAGSLAHAQGRLDRWESLFASTAAEIPALTAGSQGLELACLFVPAKAPAYLQESTKETSS